MSIRKISTKTVNQFAFTYILNAVNPDGYDQDPKTDAEKLTFVVNVFKNEYGYRIDQVGFQTAFKEYLSGLPSCINIDWENHYIISLGWQWGIITKNDSKLEDNFISNWFLFIANKFMVLCNRNKVNY